MNKLEFLEILERELKELPQEEYENVLAYYREYFEEAGIEKESEVIAELGDPMVLAQRILRENRAKNSGAGQFGEKTAQGMNMEAWAPYNEKKKLSPGWIAVIAIVGFPVWVTAAALIFFVVMALSALIFGLGLASGIMILIGALAAVVGLAMTFTLGATALFIAGMSLAVAGLGFLFFLAVLGLCKAFSALIDKIVRVFSGRRAAA